MLLEDNKLTSVHAELGRIATSHTLAGAGVAVDSSAALLASSECSYSRDSCTKINKTKVGSATIECLGLCTSKG